MATTADEFVRQVESLARSYFRRDTSPAHDWFHVQRVRTNAEALVSDHPTADVTIVRLAALLHDIGRAKEEAGEVTDHAEWGAEESEKLLQENGASDKTTEAVAHCVRAHRYSNETAPETIEAKIVSDADNLDALGAVGVARCFAYGGEIGEPIHDPSLPPDEDDSVAGRTQFNHIHKKLLDVPNRMYTDAGKDLADERAEYVRRFVEQFKKEAVGGR
ncbi:MAG: HD domain-containing protein [Haloferacaceae archaeon]